MPPLKKFLLPATVTVLAAALLLPASASAAPCSVQPKQPACQMLEKRQEANDKQRGVTPACRAAADKYYEQRRKHSMAKGAIKEYKAALKKKLSKKKKKEYSKGLKAAKKSYAKAKKAVPKLKSSGQAACKDAQVKPPGLE